MSAENSTIPTEAIALVHHIELNKAGWWDKTVQRLITACIWLAGEPRTLDGIKQGLESSFRLTLPIEKIEAQVHQMESKGALVELPDGRFRIPEERRKRFESEIGEAEEVERKACALFGELFLQIDPEKGVDDLWKRFNRLFLSPLVKQVGVSAYRLLAGERMEVDKKLEQKFLKSLPPAQAPSARKAIGEFLDPKKPEVCAYIGRMLHARFCVEASGLSDTVLTKLNASLGRHIRFRMFVDTNFLFSLMELHENPSNAAALELKELLERLNGNPKVDLVVTPDTIEEAKSSISYTKGRLNGLPSGVNFTEAALRARFSGMAIRFLNQRLARKDRLSPEEWFDPYVKDFVPLARGKGVELHNEKMDEYSMRQDVVDDIHVVINSEKRLPPERRKSYEKIAHDMKLWHFVNDKRPAYSESPIDVTDWILTVDFRLIGFDGHKQKKAAGQFPVCLHPTSFIQLLQFWVPRSPEFEEAMLGSLRLPFLFEDFDVEGEKTSLKILKGIGRYEGSEELSSQTITHVMLNDGLRARLKTDHPEEEELQMIRDALVAEIKSQADSQKDRADGLAERSELLDTQLNELRDENAALKDERAAFLKERDASSALLDSQGVQISSLNARLTEMEAARRLEESDRKERSENTAALAYRILAVATLLGAVAAGWKVFGIWPVVDRYIGGLATSAIVGVIVFVVGHLILERKFSGFEKTQKLRFLGAMRWLRKWSWSFVAAIMVFGVFPNLYSNWIQKNIDADVVPAGGENGGERTKDEE